LEVGLEELAGEDGLVGLEGEAVIEGLVLIYVDPGAVGAGLVVVAVVYDPLVAALDALLLVLLVEPDLDVALDLREQLVVDFDLAVGRPPNQNVALPILHLIQLVLEVLTVAGAPEQLQLQSLVRLASLLCTLGKQVDHHVGLPHVNQHVVLEYGRDSVHAPEDSEADAQVLDKVLLRKTVEPDLEVAAHVQLGLLVVAGGDHEVVHHHLLLTLRVHVLLRLLLLLKHVGH